MKNAFHEQIVYQDFEEIVVAVTRFDLKSNLENTVDVKVIRTLIH